MRKAGALLLDLLLCGFLGWTTCWVLEGGAFAPGLAGLLLLGLRLWGRDRLQPTFGEHLLGIQYLASASSQVITDIQVLDPRRRIPPVLVAAGILDVALGFAFLAGWTLFPASALFGEVRTGGGALAGWLLPGLSLLWAGTDLLSGSRLAPRVVAVLHAALAFEAWMSRSAWLDALQDAGAGEAFLTAARIFPPSFAAATLALAALLYAYRGRFTA